MSEQSEFFKFPVVSSSAGQSAFGGPSERLPFLSPLRCWFVFFGQAKKMNV
jgi:hypothetical protein